MKTRVRSVLLGAGFSKWAAGLPLANELFDFEIGDLSQADMRRLARIQIDWQTWTTQNPGQTAEQFVFWSLNTSTHRKSRVTWYITRRLSEPFMTRIQGNFATMMINDRKAREDPGTLRAKSFLLLMKASKIAGIVTPNYDMLTEFALGTSGFNYGEVGEYLEGRGHNPQFPWQNRPVFATGDTPLAKIHGSLSWDRQCKWTDGKPGRAGTALIVPPAPEKERPSSLADVWKLAETILARSTELIVFGFAFNPYDGALLELLKTAGAHLNRILIVDPYPQRRAAKTLWPHARISTVTEMADPLASIGRWIK